MNQRMSVAELVDQGTVDGRVPITWELEPPSTIDPEQVAVNLSTLRGLARCGGFSEVNVTGYYGEQEQVSSGSAQITGINLDGSATGLATSAATKTETRRVSVKGGQPISWTYKRPSIKIAVEQQSLGSRIADRVRADRRPSDEARQSAWAHEVDEQVRRGLTRAAWDVLVVKPVSDRPDMTGGMAVLALVTSMAPTSWEPYASLALFYGIDILEAYKDQRSRNIPDGLRGYKPNVVFPFGIQLDRLAVTAAVANVPRLSRIVRSEK